jgi:single-strand DNA-binding protein
LGRDADLRVTPSGANVLDFSVAVSVGFGDKKETLWVSCALWGDRGEKLQPFLTKGKSVTVAGDVGIRTYTTRGGDHRAELTLNVQRVTLQGDAPDRSEGAPQSQRQPANATGNAQPKQEEFDDDIPF